MCRRFLGSAKQLSLQSTACAAVFVRANMSTKCGIDMSYIHAWCKNWDLNHNSCGVLFLQRGAKSIPKGRKAIWPKSVITVITPMAAPSDMRGIQLPPSPCFFGGETF